MSIELNKPDTNDHQENSKDSLGFLLILSGLFLELINQLFRGWFNPFFVLIILVGWFLVAENNQRFFRIGVSVLLIFIFFIGGFLGKPIYHLVGIGIGVWELLSSKRLKELMKITPPSFNLVAILQQLKGLFKTVSLVFLGVVLLAVVFYFGSREFMYRSETISELSAMNSALQKYKSDTGKYPESLAQLIGNDPLKKDWMKDGWGNPYSFRSVNGEAKVSSSGSDGTAGNSDDIQ